MPGLRVKNCFQTVAAAYDQCRGLHNGRRKNPMPIDPDVQTLVPQTVNFVSGKVVSIVITVIVLLICLGALLIGFFRSKSRGLFSTLVHVVNVAFSLVWAGLATGAAMISLGGVFSKLSVKLIEQNKITFLQTNESAQAVASQLPGALIAPFMFVLFFFIFKIIGDIVIFFVVKGERRDLIGFKGQKWVAALVGIILTVVCLTVFFAPLAGTFRTAGEIMTAVESSGLVKADKDGNKPQAYVIASEIIGASSNVVPLKIIDSNLGGGLLYDKLSVVTVNGKSMSLPNELKALSAVVQKFMSLDLMDENGKLKEDFKFSDLSSALRDMSKEIGNAEITTTIIGEEFSDAVDKWKNGESALGLKLMTGNDKVDDLIGGMLKCFDNTDSAQSLKDVLNFSADVVEVLPEKVMSGEEMSSKELLSQIDVKGTVGLIGKTYENETMRGFTDSLIKWILRRAAEAVNVDAEEKIEAINLDNYTIKEVNDLEDRLSEMVETAVQFQDKLITNEKLTEEENNILVEAIGELRENKIIGEAVSFIYEAAKENNPDIK